MGSEAWRLADPQACRRESGRAPGQPAPSSLRSTCLLLQNKSSPCPGQTSPLHLIFSLTAGTDAGIWRQRAWGTWSWVLALEFAWPPASAPSPPARPDCWARVWCQPPGGHSWAQASRPQACRVDSRTGPGARGTPRGLPSDRDLAGWAASAWTQRRLQVGQVRPLSWTLFA